MDFTDSPHVPVTDSPFSSIETLDAIRELKNNKRESVCVCVWGGGACGTPQGLLKVPKDKCIIYITMLRNLVQLMPFTPVHWAFSRLIVLFKKGNKLDCGNYGGIAIMDSIAKLFDLLLCRRLELWFKPQRE